VVALISKLLKPPPPHPEEHPRNAWRQYHARYALLVLAFVVFDMEMEFMYPWAVAFRSQGIVGFGDMLVFVVILGVALTYMWRTGVLDFERRMNEALVLLGVAVVANLVRRNDRCNCSRKWRACFPRACDGRSQASCFPDAGHFTRQPSLGSVRR